ncbi:MAG: hypothetical protein DI551_04180 [Micavibrio aeruginosavorus]|uniref:YjbH domain-containing protein n=1 Tax=Micavibrio aeruginosavorus TaxID=349221 RepID=A0A2W5N0P1_9BACT|nr:MAG: hypothetical protein DI551_04180 [Micavibrio aeruginosavorus]
MAYANEVVKSTNFKGMIGLNTIPTARMDEEGIARAGLSTLDPYNHAFIGMQIAKPLYVNLRQSMEVSSIGEQPHRVYPGMDFKLRLGEEGRYAPEIAFGMDSALGHKRFSSEYFALSKRYYNFDFTAGIAWGRMGSGGILPNPLARLSSHFDRERNYTDQNAASPADWFTGKEIGLFGGFEYALPIEGLSFKADIGADRSPGERRSFDFDAPALWSVGFNYNPTPWFGFGTSLIGGDKIMARITLQDNLYKRKIKSYKDNPAIAGKDEGMFGKLWAKIQRGGDDEPSIHMGEPVKDGRDLAAVLHLNDAQPSAMQIGRAAKALAAKADKDTATITIIPARQGLRGNSITLSKRDVQNLAEGNASPEEVWQDASFSQKYASSGRDNMFEKLKLFPELSISPQEEETTHLYRASLVAEKTSEWKYGFLSGAGLRLNIADNLHRLSKFKNINLKSVRGDADYFTANRVNAERAYIGWMHTILPDIHFAATAGILEEMYAGYGGEILYRPSASPFAIGLEGWNAFKRDPTAPLALGLRGDDASWTGHGTLYYDIPNTDLTAYLKAGRFLGGDWGASGGAETQFDNGVKIKGYVTATNSDDKDVFGADRNVIAGLQLAIPLGGLKFIPEGSAARIKAEPMGRDDGQMLDKPLSLYEATEPMSYRRLGRNWQAVQN